MLERLVDERRARHASPLQLVEVEKKNMKMMLLMVVGMIAFGVVAYGEDKTTVVEIKLPKPAYTGTPKNIPPGTTAEKPTGKPRAPWTAPAGVKNLALNRSE